MDEKNTAVITYIDSNYDMNLERDFMETLRNVSQYKGEVVVIDYGMDESIRERIEKKYNVTFFRKDKDMPVFSLRYKHIPKVIESLPEHITNVMIIDGGDVWFQKQIAPIFQLTNDKVGYVEEVAVFDQHKWTIDCLNILDDKTKSEVLKYCAGKQVKNSGMVCGPRNSVKKLIENVYLDMRECGIEYFGVDQIFFNYECCKSSSDEVLCLDDEYNYVLITNKGEFTLKDDFIYDSKSRLITVVHNAGAKWRVLNRDYKGDIVDGEQYMPHNVRKMNPSG